MKPDEPSRTALIIARQRAAHQVLDHGSILYDPFAMKILREDEKDVLQFANKHPLASIGRLFTAARSRIAEDALSRAVETGVRQIVILGAGLDTFALRDPHGGLEIYEVDHPATQAGKRERLAEAQIALPPWLILVPVDFERDDLGAKLVAAGFQQNSPAFFTWLGVVPYLTQHAIGRTLDYISSIQNSEVVFDYMEPPEAFSEDLRQLEKARAEQLEKMGERSVTPLVQRADNNESLGQILAFKCSCSDNCPLIRVTIKRNDPIAFRFFGTLTSDSCDRDNGGHDNYGD